MKTLVKALLVIVSLLLFSSCEIFDFLEEINYNKWKIETKYCGCDCKYCMSGYHCCKQSLDCYRTTHGISDDHTDLTFEFEEEILGNQPAE